MLRKGVVFKWNEQCNNAFNLQMSDLAKMPRLQYLNLNKAFKLFTNASKHSYSGILDQEEALKEGNVVPNLVPIVYFSGSFSKMQQLWNTTQKECYAVYRSIQKFSLYLASTKCTLYHDHKPLAPFLTTGMSNLVLDHWVLELQQFNIQFEHISGKKNVVADAIFRIGTLGLYQDNGNDDLATTDDNVVDNVMEGVHAIEWIPNLATYKMEKLDILRGEEQWQDTFCMKKVKMLRTKGDSSFMLDENGILLKMVRLRYTIEPTIVVPRKLTFLIIVDFHNGKGDQGISCTVNMIGCNFWWVGMHRHIHQHISSCQLCIQFLPNWLYAQPMHLDIPSPSCWMCHGLH